MSSSGQKILGGKQDTTFTDGKHANCLDIDLTIYHERFAGRLVLDPKCASFNLSCYLSLLADQSCIREARVEFGDEVASRLKLSPDGRTVLWPQPSDDPEDPQNVCP
jgi:hypothetical protein